MGKKKGCCTYEFLVSAKTWEQVNVFNEEFSKYGHTSSNEQNHVKIKVEPEMGVKIEPSIGQKCSVENKLVCQSTLDADGSITMNLLLDPALVEDISQNSNELPSSSSTVSALGYSCTLCKACFSVELLLRSHLVTHNICSECGVGCPSRKFLLHHLKSHSNDLTHICSYCGLFCQTTNCLLQHMMTHEDPMIQRECKECGMTFPSKGLLLRHLKSHPSQICDICGKVFEEKNNLTQHRRKCLRTVTVTDESIGQAVDVVMSFRRTSIPNKQNEYLLVSEIRESASESSTQLDSNLLCRDTESSSIVGGEIDRNVNSEDLLNRRIYGNSLPLRSDADGIVNVSLHGDSLSSIEVTPDLAMIDKSYKCRLCKERFSEKSILKSHLLTHNVCTECGLSCLSKSVLIDHMKCHTGHVCKICGETFAERIGLVKHYCCLNTNPYTCERCHKTFSRKSSLTAHAKVHRKGDKYHCVYDNCRMTYSSKNCWKRHIMHHPGTHNRKEYVTMEAATSLQPVIDEPHGCTICPKVFSKISNLKTHLLKTHNVCSDCGLVCSSQSLLLHHMKTHPEAKPYPCKHCEESFASLSNLNRHLAFHAGVKPLTCGMCNKTFSAKRKLRKHFSVCRGVTSIGVVNS